MITMDKKYQYRCGGDARILCNDGPDPKYPVVSMDHAGDLRTHTPEGCINEQTRPRHYDLIEVVPLWRDTLWVHADGRSTSGSMANYHGWRKIEAVEVRKEGA